MSVLFSIVMAIAVGIGLTVFLTAIKASRVRLKPMRAEAIDLLRVPEGARAVLDVGRRWLLPRGFRYVGSWRIRPMIAAATEWKYCDVYASDDAVTFAAVTQREHPSPGDVAAIEFQSVFADGTVMSTFNRYRHALVWEPPKWKISDDYVPDMAVALENHRKRVGSCGQDALADPAERDRMVGARMATFVDDLVKAGRAWRTPKGEVLFRFLPTLKYAAQLLRGNTRAAKVRIVPLDAGSADAVESLAPERAGVAADMHSYFTRRATQASATGGGKWRLGAVSAVAFIAVGALVWDPVLALILLGVIAFHEAGHYFAMKAVGYRNLHVFFVPGLGGLATGDKQDASVAQKVLVYLAGPVPGIALATAGFIALPASASIEYPWLQQLLMVTLTVNLINLLPVTPLDGGRVIEALLFLRWPRLRVVFTGVSAAALVVVGQLTGDTPMFVIGVLVALALPAQLRLARLARAIGRAPTEKMDEKSAAERVFKALSMAPFTKWSFAHRATAADELIGQIRTPMPGVIGIGAGLTLYAACFLVPAAAALLAWPGGRETIAALWEVRETMREIAEEGDATPTPIRPQRDWSAEIEQSRRQPPERRLALLTEATEAGYMTVSDTERELKTRRAEMKGIADSLPRGNFQRVRALFSLMDEETENSQPYRDDVRALIAELGNATGSDEVRLRARMSVALAGAMDSSPERLELLRQSRDVLRDKAKPGEGDLGMAWSQLAVELAHQGNAAAADAEWLAMLKWFENTQASDPVGNVYVNVARMGYSRSLMQQARFDDVQAFLQPGGDEVAAQVAQGKRRALIRNLWQVQDLFWLAIQKGDAAQASAWLDLWGKSTGATKSSYYQVAQLALADVRHDQAGAEDARKRITESRLAALSCRAAWPRYEGTEIGVKRVALISRYKICEGVSK